MRVLCIKWTINIIIKGIYKLIFVFNKSILIVLYYYYYYY